MEVGVIFFVYNFFPITRQYPNFAPPFSLYIFDAF